MLSKRDVLIFETEVPGVEVQALITDECALYIQIRDTEWGITLKDEYIPLSTNDISKRFITGHLEGIAQMITEPIYVNLVAYHFSRKYKLYVKNGWTKDFKEFQAKYFKELGVEGMNEDV